MVQGKKYYKGSLISASPQKGAFLCLSSYCHRGSSEANRAKCSHLQYQEQFCWLLWLLHINQDAREQDLVCCIYNWWNEVSILHPRLLTIEAQTPSRIAWCSRWVRSPLLGSSPRNFKFCSHIYSGPRFSHFSTARYQFPCNSLNRFFGNSCGCCITREKSLMHIALECYLELRWFSKLVLL